MRRALLVILLLFFGVSSAQLPYRTEPAGGPLTLAEDVAAAFEALEAVEASDFSAEPAEDASTLIAYGNPSAFGPDTVSLTLSRLDAGSRDITVLLNPGARELLSRALLHEAGILAGLNRAETGVMNPALSEESPETLTEADIEALRALQSAVPEDVNRDGVVNFYDLAELAEAFGRSGVNLGADINEDGVVDEADIEALRAAYEFSPPSQTDPFAEVEIPDEALEEFEEEVPGEDVLTEEGIGTPEDEETGEEGEAGETGSGETEDGGSSEDSYDDSDDGEGEDGAGSTGS